MVMYCRRHPKKDSEKFPAHHEGREDSLLPHGTKNEGPRKSSVLRKKVTYAAFLEAARILSRL